MKCFPWYAGLDMAYVYSIRCWYHSQLEFTLAHVKVIGYIPIKWV